MTDIAFKGTIGNQALPSLHGWWLETTLTDPLIWKNCNRVLHETHRKRFLYSPWVARSFVPKFPGLEVSKDGRVFFFSFPSLFVNNPFRSFFQSIKKLILFVLKTFVYFSPFLFISSLNDLIDRLLTFVQ